MSNKEQSPAGKELLSRLKRFTNQLESLDKPSQLAEILTVRKVKLNLRPKEFDGEDVKAIRVQFGISQGVLAEFLGVSVSTVQDWEQGIRPPNGPACRVMEEMSRDVEGWGKRIRELASTAST